MNTLLKDKTFKFSELKAFADDKFKIASMMKFAFVRIENVGKGENIDDQHFLLLPQCFQKALFLGTVKD